MIEKFAATFLAGAVALTGCHKSADKAAADAVKVVTVPEVARFVQEKSAVIFDANGTETRKEFGVVPGAVLLSNSKTYPLTDLPAEKSTNLVFYCGGVMCRASDHAAERAVGAGYTNVNVMREGIKGWSSAGQKTDVPTS